MLAPKGFRTLPDGRIYAPHRGKPPEAPNGYEQDRNSFVFHPIIDCPNRITKVEKRGCCDSPITRCQINGDMVQYIDCLKCIAKEPLPEESLFTELPVDLTGDDAIN